MGADYLVRPVWQSAASTTASIMMSAHVEEAYTMQQPSTARVGIVRLYEDASPVVVLDSVRNAQVNPETSVTYAGNTLNSVQPPPSRSARRHKRTREQRESFSEKMMDVFEKECSPALLFAFCHVVSPRRVGPGQQAPHSASYHNLSR